MIIFKTRTDLQQYLLSQQEQGKKIGFIPTMGALHQGHISLVNRATEEGTFPVCSIFVNPAQFNDKQDFELYPSTIAEDISLLDQAGCAVLFLPSVTEVYPEGPDKARSYDFGFLDTVFEGARRPGHFTGVGKVMGLLLEIIQPDVLYMGSKDYQQCLVVKDLCRQMGLQLRFVSCPTRREPDGLAMSSRNKRLTEPQRARSGLIYQCLVSIQGKSMNGTSFSRVRKECLDLLTEKGFMPEYVSLADADTLQELDDYDPNRKMIALIAARIGDIRLIDNMSLN